MTTLLVVLIACGFAAGLFIVAMYVLGAIEAYLPEADEPPIRVCPPCDGHCNQGRDCPVKETN